MAFAFIQIEYSAFGVTQETKTFGSGTPIRRPPLGKWEVTALIGVDRSNNRDLLGIVTKFILLETCLKAFD